MNYTNEKSKLDEEIEQNGVKVLIDNKAVMYLLGTKMDYIEDEIKSEFVFDNPNSKGSCGCGESFNV
jgi:iron-sulfur cluster assembly accessory protein